MTEFKTPFETMIAQAQDMATAMNPALADFAPKGFDALWPTMPKELMELTFGKGANQNGLDAKTRLLVTLAGLTMLGASNGTQIRMTARHALEAGATAEEVGETIAQMAIFAGVPAMTRAMDHVRDVLDEHQEKDDPA